MDLPRKKEVVEALRDAKEQPDPEAMREEVKRELMYELKSRELDIRDRESLAREKLVAAQTVQTGVAASYSAMQAGAQIAQMPQIAPVADAVMMGAGYTRPNKSEDPNFPTAEMVPPMPQQGPGPADGAMAVQSNTSPAFPPIPDDGASPMAGIETPTITDNIGA